MKSVTVKVVDYKGVLPYIFGKIGLIDETIFDRIRYFHWSCFSYSQEHNVKPFFVLLLEDTKIIGVAKVGYFDLSAHNERDWSISFFSIDKHYRGKGYSRLMADALFSHAKEVGYEISTSSYTVLGKAHLQHLFNEYANKHGVIFHDKKETDYLHDTEDYYVIVDGKKLHKDEVNC